MHAILKHLYWWFWQGVSHNCVENPRVRISGFRGVCKRCGRTMWKDPR